MSRKVTLLQSFNAVDDQLLERCQQTPPSPWKRWGGLAACACLLLTAVLLLTQPAAPPAPSEASGAESTPSGESARQDPSTSGAPIEDTTGCAAPTDPSTSLTLAEAQALDPHGAYLPPGPEGFQAESVRFTETEGGGILSVLWTKGNGSYDELRWTVSPYTASDAQRLTSPADRENYDLSLYPIPRADSVPEALREIVDHPIFPIEELTLETVQRRTYTTGETGDSPGPRLSFGVLYGDMVIEVTAKGVSPEWVYQQLLQVHGN